MKSEDILWNPRLTHQLVQEQRFADNKVVLVDVGARAGIPEQWSMFKDQLHVVGFEPDVEECRALNEAKTEWSHSYYPYCLDSIPRDRQFILRPHNRASNGLYPSTWWSTRFGVASAEDAQHGIALAQRGDQETIDQATQIKTTTYAAVAEDQTLPQPDFMKIDVEGGSLDVLRGAEGFLSKDGIIGIEFEGQFVPQLASPLVLDVYSYLAQCGYLLFNISTYRLSRKVLPMPLAWDHRDHEGNPIMVGPTTKGQIVAGDAVFFRDLIADQYVAEATDRKSQIRVLKAAAIMEIYNLPDCAAELLIYYRNALSNLVNVDDLLAQLVPNYFGRPLSYGDYIRLYNERLGRL